MRHVTLYLLLVTTAVVLIVRIAGPSDLYDQEQPRTVSYTIDMLEHGRWALPMDGDGIRATKPPLYNWIALPFVAAFGPHEWAMKMPSVIGGLATLWLVVWMTRWMLRRGLAMEPGERGAIDAGADRDATRAAGIDAVALVAGLCWLVNYMSFKLIYLARPDGVLVAALCGAWVCATVALAGDGGNNDARKDADDTERHSPRRPWRWALGFWLCTAAAALAKGPLAVLALIYAVAAGRLIGGRWRALGRLGWWWGLPLMLAIVAAWLVPAILSDPQAFGETMLGEEVVDRAEQMTPWYMITSAWQVPFYTLTRFAPWSVFALLTLIHITPRRWFAGALGPAFLWTAVVTGVFLLATKRADRLAPMFVGLAPLAAYWLVIVARKYRVTPAAVAAAALAIAVGLGAYNFTTSPSAKSGYGARLHAFADDVRRHAGDEPVAVVDVRARDNPIAALLGHARAAETATPQQLQRARWIISPVRDDDHASLAVTVSQPVPISGDTTRRLGLYRVGP